MMKASPSPAPTRARAAGGLAWWSRHGALAAFAVLLILNIAITPHFLSVQTLNINLTQVCTIIIVAVGMNLVIATGGIDLSVGSLMAISGVIAPMIFMGAWAGAGHIGIAVALAVVAAVAVAGLLGVFNGWLVARFGIQPIVATLILFIAGRGIAQVLVDGNLQTFTVPEFAWIGQGALFGIPTQVFVMAAMVFAAVWTMRRTRFGRYVLAVGGNERAAVMAGLPVRRIKIAVYAVSGLCAGVAGLVVIAINSASDSNQIGLGNELDAIAAVAVGGSALTGGQARLLGTVLGALTIQLIRYTLLANGVPDAAALVVKAAVIALAVWLQQAQRRT
ncbi:ABC transporter permease [Pararobbsia silviterrae]|uniref:ABC transporter permease n=1 Tax=Pararobbsia silviterrae TaxID=1792498 RepID=A0A494XMD6_9BURK|nr:ABC transporter permease [Pararobbsia silviterrae]RKP51850.1 ABC transporter permease [Pararobbsia silviterrae]